MITKINPLQLRAVLGRDTWDAPHSFGSAGWRMFALDDATGLPRGTVIVTQSPLDPDSADHTEWIHASMSWAGRVPTYEEICALKRGVWGDRGEAYEVHARAERHINIHPNALHLWGRADGRPVLPDFGRFGRI